MKLGQIIFNFRNFEVKYIIMFHKQPDLKETMLDSIIFKGGGAGGHFIFLLNPVLIIIKSSNVNDMLGHHNSVISVKSIFLGLIFYL